ncbi:glycosyltransferase family 4 protein [Variovorax sp. PBL-E5]|uniref:glycosyltransferase family 4 protein n=1 Tax=Variovorax sp. PBL-E5 TaxID=434014 RepID=UPI0013189753|nr:glycosyltransferase family 4 protein [Variovorax sp. PBL-E5]VTU18995.1 Glycosyl transferases group 1 [Variovorax sp. PBL-E5]
MKLVFFTPFGTASAIGRVTALLLTSLERLGHTAIIVRTERDDLLDTVPHACTVPVLRWNDEADVEEVTRDADALVYQIGNNYAYHCGGLHWLGRLPGIVCLHDFLLAHMFSEWSHRRPTEAASVLERWYGEQAPLEFFEASASTPQAFMDMASQLYPMTEWVCAEALAVVSHSHWGMHRVAASCAGPLSVLALPYDAPGAVPAAIRDDERLRIVTVGHVNPNKRVDSVIRAIGTSERLRETVSYRLCGLIQSHVADELSALARTLGVDLTISGEMSDPALQQAMAEADVACCLRWPSFEAASATTIEALLYGKAVVVTDAAFYSELPDDCVRKVAPSSEIADLRAVLEELAADTGARRGMARRGQAWAKRTFSADAYVANLIEMSRLAAAARPVLAMVKTMGELLGGWQASPALLTADEIAEPLALFQTTPRLPSPENIP